MLNWNHNKSTKNTTTNGQTPTTKQVALWNRACAHSLRSKMTVKCDSLNKALRQREVCNILAITVLAWKPQLQEQQTAKTNKGNAKNYSSWLKWRKIAKADMARTKACNQSAQACNWILFAPACMSCMPNAVSHILAFSKSLYYSEKIFE